MVVFLHVDVGAALVTVEVGGNVPYELLKRRLTDDQKLVVHCLRMVFTMLGGRLATK